ncbi:MAG: helix-turn-helix domain-containing protein [Anaerobutyricum hallii]|uniref:helix-turn-helix domain-containing protein n=1 Tax=Anaerobutyricum hallii TaxID=39488 RepID=UPI0039943A20
MMSDDFYKKIFSKNLRYYMELNQKEQIDIINDLGFNKSSVSTWCNGTRLPRMDKVDALAKYFGINRSDLIEERKNNTSISSFIQCQTKDEETLVLSYRELNNINKKKCMVYSKNLLSTQRMESELLAAHQRTDIEVTPEGIQNDLNIMNDDSLWK